MKRTTTFNPVATGAGASNTPGKAVEPTDPSARPVPVDRAAPAGRADSASDLSDDEALAHARRIRQRRRAQLQEAGSGGAGKVGPPAKRGKSGLDVSPARPGAPEIPLLPTAGVARRKSRHLGIVLSFLLLVVLPLCVAGWYFYQRAADQYGSQMGFSVRKEEGTNAAEMVGGLIDFGAGTTSDTDVLYEFIQSQGLVERIDEKLDLRRIFSRPENDPIFTVASDAPIEELVRYWRRMVTIYYDGATGLIETRVLAFTPDDAQTISYAIFDESSAMINRLTKVAREDTTRYAREELGLAEERLRGARTDLTEFRARTQLVDPNIDIQGQMGLLNNLQGQLAESLIELDMLNDNTREGDPRIRQAEQRISIIENRIAEERKQFGMGETASGGRAYASLVGEYETLTVDREFAEQTYLAALANYDAAQAEAQRKTRYLAAYAEPTLAQSSEYPQRLMLLAVFGLFATAIWAVGVLIYYSVRDRR